jgi:hypothetical protein
MCWSLRTLQELHHDMVSWLGLVISIEKEWLVLGANPGVSVSEAPCHEGRADAWVFQTRSKGVSVDLGLLLQHLARVALLARHVKLSDMDLQAEISKELYPCRGGLATWWLPQIDMHLETDAIDRNTSVKQPFHHLKDP